MDLPASGDAFHGVTLTSHSTGVGIGRYLQNIGVDDALLGNAVWPVANKAIMVPVVIPRPITVARVFWLNGAAVSGNVAVALHDQQGHRYLTSGSTAQASTNAIQNVNITDTAVPPGRAYLTMACDNVTAQFLRLNVAAVLLGGAGVLEKTSAFAPPDPITFSAITSAYLPCFGVTCRDLI